MSRVRNANEFLLRIRGATSKYNECFSTRIRDLRARYADSPAPKKQLLDESLEAHIRAYVVNDLLAGLNWRQDQQTQDGLPNLVPEAPVRSSQSKGTVRFLDYLGFECGTTRPLLIVETKRPSASLPRLSAPASPASFHSEVVVRGLKGESLVGDWNTWLDDIRDYVSSILAGGGTVPRRVLVTNGDWIILFVDPQDSFFHSGTQDPSQILVFQNAAEVQERFSELFQLAEYSKVLGAVPPLSVGEIGFYLKSSEISHAMYGLRIRYDCSRGIYSIVPAVSVAPVLYVVSRFYSWICVEDPPTEFPIPHDQQKLDQHLASVREQSLRLLHEVNGALGLSLPLRSIEDHYASSEGFDALPGVRESAENEYFVLTGDHTHYLHLEPTVEECRYHDWSEANKEGRAQGVAPVLQRTVGPRSFFFSKESHHCAHKFVFSAKASQIDGTNRESCGPRSGRDGEAFCEIWRFDEHLCCRTCVFESVCTKSAVFNLPCVRKSPKTGAENSK